MATGRSLIAPMVSSLIPDALRHSASASLAKCVCKYGDL